MLTREEKIARLTDQQALSIVDSLVGEFAAEDIPEGKTQQIQALETFFIEEGTSIDISQAAQADQACAAVAARQLLVLLGNVEEVQPSLDEWLDHPPTQETMAIPLILAAPIVVAGCIMLLYIVGHVHFECDNDGKWTFSYNKPEEKSAMDEHIKDFTTTMTQLMQSMIPGSGIANLPDNTTKPDKPGGTDAR